MAKGRGKSYNKPLTPLQEKFCLEYIKDMHPQAAAIRAGYSPQSAKSVTRIMKIPKVRRRIAQLQAELKREVLVDTGTWLKELMAVGFSNIQDYLDVVDGVVVVKDLRKINRTQATAIASIKQTENQTVTKKGKIYRTIKTEFKLHDKLEALDKIGKHLGLYEADNRKDLHITIEQVYDELIRDCKSGMPNKE